MSGWGQYLVWSDIPNDVQHRWLQDNGAVTTIHKPAGHSNGNTFDREGRQISFEHGNRRVVRYEADGSLTVLADKFEGKPFNAPNDGVVHPDGSIWFTDPGYGSLGNYEGNKGDLVLKEAVYRIDRSGKVQKMTDEIFKPNGLCFSADYKKVYVADTGASHYPKAPKNIKVWDMDGEKVKTGASSLPCKWTSTARRWPGSRMAFVATRTATSGLAQVGAARAMTACRFSRRKANASDKFCYRKCAAMFVSEARAGIGSS